jgi:hypothetical protein
VVDLITREDMDAFMAREREAQRRQQIEREAAAQMLFEPRAVYSRQQVAEIFAARRRGEWSGTEAEWARLEVALIRAAAEGRVAGALSLWGAAREDL